MKIIQDDIYADMFKVAGNVIYDFIGEKEFFIFIHDMEIVIYCVTGVGIKLEIELDLKEHCQ